MSNADLVKEFTEQSTGIVCPVTPRAMTKSEVSFLIKMCVSELVELAQTVADDNEESMEMVRSSVDVDLKTNYKKPTTETELIAEQADAPVDMWYYSLNALAKVGVNASKVFDEVHRANMNKKWDDGKFHRREDGKIIKPDNWQEPNMVAVIQDQIENGW
jgi:predicted HAD superfamily Cof-like phosphohydrolase